MKSIFVSPYLADGSTGGGLVSRMNLQLLQKISSVTHAFALSNNKSVAEYTCIGAPTGKWATALCNLFAIAGRLKPATIITILRHLRTERPDLLFLDSSSLGWLALLCRIMSPDTHIIGFFHNIEFDFQLERSRAEGRQYWLAALAEYISERLITRFSNRLMMFTREDSSRALQLYRRAADLLAPVVLNDTFADIGAPAENPSAAVTGILFVGSNFFANRQAVQFLLEQLAPRIKSHPTMEIWIAGSGFSPQAWPGDIPANVRMYGRVDDLGALYRSAAVVAVPVISGAGMKVKVAEALMHGCPVIGTPLALRGYLDDSNTSHRHLRTASTPDEYATAIQFVLNHHAQLRREARLDYEQRFSVPAGEQRLRQLLARA
jgi:glycosyltransferase involved in cell wall biosynthesis